MFRSEKWIYTSKVKYIFSFTWFPVLFTILGVLFPFPMFSLHGGPAWLLLILSVPCMLIFYINRVVRSSREQRWEYVGINFISLIVYLLLVCLASYLVSSVVMEVF